MNTSKLKTLLALAFTLLISYGVSAQDYTFKVISVKGDAKVDGAALQVGSKIQSGTITVGNGALLNIVHKGGKPLNVSKAGTYKVDVLDKACSAEPGSLSERYAQFVLKELTTGDDSGIGAKNQGKTGSVDRGLEKPIAFLDPYRSKEEKKSTMVIDGKVTLQWFPNPKDDKRPEDNQIAKYLFVAKNLMGETLISQETTEGAITLDLTEKKLSNQHLMYTVVAIGHDGQKWTSKEYMLKPLKKTESMKIKQDLESIASDNSALSKLIVAKYFEEKGLVANALYAYEEALKLSDSNDMYKNMYQAFLDRNYLRRKSAHMSTKGKEKEKEKKENK